MNEEKKVLLGMTLDELKDAVKTLGMPAFTGGQIAKWLYEKHVKSIDEMTNLSRPTARNWPSILRLVVLGLSTSSALRMAP
jgi:hypothetical protein